MVGAAGAFSPCDCQSRPAALSTSVLSFSIGIRVLLMVAAVIIIPLAITRHDVIAGHLAFRLVAS